MSKSLKITIVAAAAILLSAFLMLGALMLDSGTADSQQKNGGKEDAEDVENTKKPSKEEDDDDEADEKTVALSVLSVDISDYPLIIISCTVTYEDSGETLTGLEAADFSVKEQSDSTGWISCAVTSFGEDRGTYHISYQGAEQIPANVSRSIFLNLYNEEYSAKLTYEFTPSAEDAPPEVSTLPARALKSDDYYVVIRDDLTWWEALEACEDMGGHLVTFETEAEYRQVLKLVEDADLPVFWAGACLEQIEQSWDDASWINGEPMEFTDWYAPSNEPNKETDDELYLMIFRVNGVWGFNDAPPDSNQYYLGKIGYVCEFE